MGAKSIAGGTGYRISSLPGEPAQTKYQPLFSLLLAPCWWLGAAFPQVLHAAALITFGLAVLYFLAVWRFARAMAFSPPLAAAIASWLAISPWLIYWALISVSDYLFGALVLACFGVMRTKPDQLGWWLAAGAIGAAAALTKVAGILIVPAICAATWKSKRWKRTAYISTPIGLAFVTWTLWSTYNRPAGNNQVLWYYTNYLGYHLKSGGMEALPDIFRLNLTSYFSVIGNTLLFNMADSIIGRIGANMLLVGAVAGTLRIIRRTGAVEYPVFCLLLSAVLLVWNFSPNARLMAPLLPMAFMGLAEEGSHIANLLRRARQAPEAGNRALTRAMQTTGYAALLLAAALNVRFIIRDIPQLMKQDRAAIEASRAIYDWCQRTLPPDTVVLAENDTYLHLYTGFHTVRAVPNSVAFYKQDQEGKLAVFTNSNQLTDFFGITHILIAPTDFGDFDAEDRHRITQALENNPRHRILHQQQGNTILEVQK
jgi:4-amino-4-deoxy-L-arabinose transferase-like glycosyltransferase